MQIEYLARLQAKADKTLEQINHVCRVENRRSYSRNHNPNSQTLDTKDWHSLFWILIEIKIGSGFDPFGD